MSSTRTMLTIVPYGSVAFNGINPKVAYHYSIQNDAPEVLHEGAIAQRVGGVENDATGHECMFDEDRL